MAEQTRAYFLGVPLAEVNNYSSEMNEANFAAALKVQHIPNNDWKCKSVAGLYPCLLENMEAGCHGN